MDEICCEMQAGVRGPEGQPGFVLRTPPLRELEWDIESEITTLSRRRLGSGSEWWIADSYRTTVHDILARLHLPVPLSTRGPESTLG